MIDVRKTAFFDAITHSATVRRALTVSLVVGTALLAINQIDRVLAGELPPVWKILLTYFTPYAVSSYSTAVPVRR
mgnify:CR=1 FL=1|jgi:hypothetical protein